MGRKLDLFVKAKSHIDYDYTGTDTAVSFGVGYLLVTSTQTGQIAPISLITFYLNLQVQ